MNPEQSKPKGVEDWKVAAEEPESVEVLVRTPEQALSVLQLKRALEDDDVRKALNALLRTSVNAAITAVDLFPGVGEVFSWGADAGKVLRAVSQRLGFLGLGFLDSTPDVKKRYAIGSEVAELFSLGVGPTHALESILQLKKDIPKIRKGLTRLKELLSEQQVELEKHQAEVQEAIDTFIVSSDSEQENTDRHE